MQVLKGNKYENTMYVWYEQLAKAEKRLSESVKCNDRFGDNQEWIKEDEAKVSQIKKSIEEVKGKLGSKNINLDYDKIKNSVVM